MRRSTKWNAGVFAGWPAGVPRLRSARRRGRRRASRRDGAVAQMPL